MSENKSEMLRLRLLTVGIKLDDAPKPAVQELPRARAEPPVINRAAIRTILRGRGAAERDISWLTASCPSKAHALAFKPPRELAPASVAAPDEPVFVPVADPKK